MNSSIRTNERSFCAFLEAVLILALTFAAQFLPKDLRTVFTFVPLLYFFIEHFLRRRSWAENGFRWRAIPRDLAANWFFIVLVSVIIQALVVWAARTWMPSFIEHVRERFPLTIGRSAGDLLLLLFGTLAGTLFEEITFRALFQARLGWLLPAPAAIGIVSAVFGIGHWAAGNPVIVAVDILLVTIDSVFYGIIFARSGNVYVSWIAHFLANLVAVGLVMM